MTDGEFELIERLAERYGAPGAGVRFGAGDDAAVTEHRGPVAISVDALVEGVHFKLPEFSHRAVGRKALAAALSDLAAMGADAAQAYLVLGIGASNEDQLVELADGIAEVARREGVSVIGGDITRSPALLLSVTAVGDKQAESPLVTRAGARPGDGWWSPASSGVPRRRFGCSGNPASQPGPPTKRCSPASWTRARGSPLGARSPVPGRGR